MFSGLLPTWALPTLLFWRIKAIFNKVELQMSKGVVWSNTEFQTSVVFVGLVDIIAFITLSY